MADWVAQLLAKMGAPDNGVTRSALYGWADSEGMPAWENNWLATTLDCCGCSKVNSSGVCAYPDVPSGVEAIWQTLQGSAYSSIVYWFKRGDNIREIYAAINQSPWCSGCQNGHYPVVLYDSISRGGNPPTPTGGPGGSVTAPEPLPPVTPTPDDWSHHIRRTGNEFHTASRLLYYYRDRIGRATRT